MSQDWRRRFHKHEKRANAAVLQHEHEWEPANVRSATVSCICGATARRGETGEVSDVIEARTTRARGYFGKRDVLEMWD